MALGLGAGILSEKGGVSAFHKVGGALVKGASSLEAQSLVEKTAVVALSTPALDPKDPATSATFSSVSKVDQAASEPDSEIYSVGPHKWVYPKVLPPAKRIPQYLTGAKIGEGTQSQVFEATDHATKKSVILKCNRRKEVDEGYEEQYWSMCIEAAVLKKMEIFQNVYAPTLLGIFDVNTKERVLVLENLGPINLRKTIAKNTLQHAPYRWLDIVSIGYQALRALSGFKQAGIVHCDLKPENMIYQSNSSTLKILDFGIAQLASQMPKDNLQTLWYRSPEIHLELGGGYPIDMWSVGCILAELVLGVPLFRSANDDRDYINKVCYLRGIPPTEWLEKSRVANKWFVKMEDGNYALRVDGGDPYRPADCLMDCLKQDIKRRWSLESGLVDQLADLIERMTRYKGRITPEQAMNHPFFRNYLFWEFIKKDPTPINVFTLSFPGAVQPFTCIDLTNTSRFVYCARRTADHKDTYDFVYYDKEGPLPSAKTNCYTHSRKIFGEKMITVRWDKVTPTVSGAPSSSSSSASSKSTLTEAASSKSAAVISSSAKKSDSSTSSASARIAPATVVASSGSSSSTHHPLALTTITEETGTREVVSVSKDSRTLSTATATSSTSASTSTRKRASADLQLGAGPVQAGKPADESALKRSRRDSVLD